MRMKKNIVNKFLRICVFLVAFLMVGCSDNVLDTNMSDSEVVFDTALPEDWNPITSTRAGIVGNTELQTKGFGVFAYYTGNDSWTTADATTPNFMNNTRVTSTDNGTTWSYSPIKYWPHNQNDKVSFFAYAPHGSSLTATGSKLNYTVPVDVRQQVDLMWSNSVTTDLKKQDNKIQFNFQHATSKIGFTMEAKIEGTSPIDEYEKVKLQIKRIVLTSNPNNAGDGTGIFYKNATLEMNNLADVAIWADFGSERQSYTLTDFVNDEITINKSYTPQPAKSIIDDDSYLMIIPQNFLTGGFDIYVEYDVNLYFNGSGADSDYNYNTYTNGCIANLKINFEPAKSYVINIRLGLKDAVLGEISITDWEEKVIDLPQLIE